MAKVMTTVLDSLVLGLAGMVGIILYLDIAHVLHLL
jgi:hypothetical protein